MAYCIRSRRVLLGSGDKRVIAPAMLEIEGNLIRAVDRMAPELYERARLLRPADGREVIDLEDHLLTPAFVNAHTHLALAFLRGARAALGERGNLVEDLFFTYEARLSAADVRAFSRLGAYEALLSGTGLVWDHYYFGEAVAGALADTGLSGVVAPTLQDLAGPGKERHRHELAAAQSIADDAAKQTRGIYAALGPHAPDTVSPTLLEDILEIARNTLLPVHMHVAQSLEELERVHAREQRSPLAYLERVGILTEAPGLVLAHGLYASTSDLALLDPAQHTLVFCPHSQMLFGFVGPAAEWSELGLTWAIGTDCAASNDSMNLQKELKIARGLPGLAVTSTAPYQELLASGKLEHAQQAWSLCREARRRISPHMEASTLLSRIWEIPGRMHPAFRAGVIEGGALANLVAWNTDHPAFWPEQDLLGALAFSDTTQAIFAMFVAGRMVGKVGDFAGALLRSDAYREARLEATERLRRLLESD